MPDYLKETDLITIRDKMFFQGYSNVICMSLNCILPALQDRALDYLSTCIDQVHTFGDILQLVIVELIYKVKGV